MKKFLLILLALLLLVGCDPGGNKPEPDPGPVDTDTGMTQEELIGTLSLEDVFFGPDGRALYFKGTDEAHWYIKETSYGREGKITGFEYLKNNKYKISVTVPAFGGNDMMEPYNEYVYDIEFVYDPTNKRFLEVNSKEFKGTFSANPIVAMHQEEIEGSSFVIYPDHHFVCKLYGSTSEEWGHTYYMDLFRDGQAIDSAIFAKGRTERILENDPASYFEIGRYYYCLVVRQSMLAHTGGNWVLVYDYKNKKTYTFDDVDYWFETDSGRYILNVATNGHYVEDEGNSYYVPDFEKYEFTENGLMKLNS